MKMDDQIMPLFPPTRLDGENNLEKFIPKMGGIYSNRRNYDFGAGQHRDVSMLSPFIRHRLVLEQDTIARALDTHGLEGAQKFIEEVIWRGYFKGWLERRPQIWSLYKQRLGKDIQMLERDRRLHSNVEAAITGQTGLDYFDSWAEELMETGYLHNHARMWFASIWIFTLNLPWALGADFFLRHLVDGDPASNTLGWRWVAGLHTRGKPYHAQDWNIAKFTGHRFQPEKGELKEVVEGLDAQEPDGLPPVQPLRIPDTPKKDIPSLLLMTAEDCRPEDFELSNYNIIGSVALSSSHLRSPLLVSEKVKEFEMGALKDTAERQHYPNQMLHADALSNLAQMAEASGAKQVITSYLPEGYLRDWINDAIPALNAAGISFAELHRPWDALIWPHATAGFFKVKKNIPNILSKAGLL
jgi:deoxyribodipyrimidine photo-lyase